MNTSFFYTQWTLIALTLAACDPSSTPTDADRVGDRQPPGRMASSRPDELGRLIDEVKDHLAEHRTAQAQAAVTRLRALKDHLPTHRQIEIDRLDAIFADESSAMTLPFKH